MRFTLNEQSAGASLGWLEKALSSDGLKERIQSGERPVVFDLDVSGRKITWPRSLAKIGMKIEDGDHNWVVSLDQPNSGALFQVLSLFEGGKRSKPWRDAFAEAGAKD